MFKFFVFNFHFKRSLLFWSEILKIQPISQKLYPLIFNLNQLLGYTFLNSITPSSKTIIITSWRARSAIFQSETNTYTRHYTLYGCYHQLTNAHWRTNFCPTQHEINQHIAFQQPAKAGVAIPINIGNVPRNTRPALVKGADLPK